jgi:lysozyme
MNRASSAAVDMIKAFEGFVPYPYACSGGTLTIGYGTTGKDAEKFTKESPITKAQAEDLLLRDVQKVDAELAQLVKIDLQQRERDALVSLVYNIGITAFAKSTLLKLLNAGDKLAAADQFDRWTIAGGKESRGLKKRRASEKRHFLGHK